MTSTVPAPDTRPAADPARPSMDVTVRYWAGARAAAGRDSDRFRLQAPATVGAVLEQVAARHRAVAPVLAVASILVDGRMSAATDALVDGSTLEVLPPFAGG